MKYLGGNFSVVMGSDLYRQNFDRIFRGKPEVMTCPKCNREIPEHVDGCENSKPEAVSDQNS